MCKKKCQNSIYTLFFQNAFVRNKFNFYSQINFSDIFFSKPKWYFALNLFLFIISPCNIDSAAADVVF